MKAPRKRLLPVSTLAALLGIGLAGTAHAHIQGNDNHGGGIDIHISATISERCGFSSQNAQVLNATADLEDAHSQSLKLRVECNSPFSISARSLYGRLVNRTASDDRSGYAFEKVYGLKLDIDTQSGPLRSGHCLSTALINGGDCILAKPGGMSSADGTADGRDATLTVDWPDQSTLSRRLAAGEYSDTIILSIAARS